MRHAEDSHVLIDEMWIATLSGTEQEVADMAFELAREGRVNWEIRRVNRDGQCKEENVGWDWRDVDWGD